MNVDVVEPHLGPCLSVFVVFNVCDCICESLKLVFRFLATLDKFEAEAAFDAQVTVGHIHIHR